MFNLRLFTALALVCAGASAQTNSALMPYQKLQFSDVNGKPIAGGLLFSYAAGSSTPIATYSDKTLSTPNSNPIVLDSAGRPPQVGTSGAIWLSAATYKFILETSLGVVVWTVDDVSDRGQLLQASLAGATGSTMVGYTAAGTGAVTETLSQKLGQIVNAQDFGVICDANLGGTSGTDNAPMIRSAIAFVLGHGGGKLYFPHSAGPNNGCGIKSSLLLATSGQGVPLTLDFDNPAAGGLIMLTGGTWSTYTSAADSASHTFGVSYGTPGCVSANAYVQMQNLQINGNYQVDTSILNPCAQEQSGVYNALFTYCLFSCIEVGAYGYNSEYDLLNLNAGLSSYGFIDAAQLRTSIRRSTFQGSGSTKTGLLVTGGQVYTDDLHCEQFAVCNDNKAGLLLANSPSCYGALNLVCFQIDAVAVGTTINNLLCSQCGGVIVKDYLNNFASGGGGFSTVSGYSLGYYSSWKDIGTGVTFLASSNNAVPWTIPGGLTVLSAMGGNFAGNLAFGLNAGVGSNPVLGQYQTGFSNCGNTHTCTFSQGDQTLMIQRTAQTGAGTTAGGGLSLLGNGNGLSPSLGLIGTNFYGNDATATAASGAGAGQASETVYSGNSILFQVASGLTAGTNFAWTRAATITAADITFPLLPTSAGTGGLYVCIDSAGNLYKKATCP